MFKDFGTPEVDTRGESSGYAVAIRCAHGDTVLYPLAKISLEVEGQSIDVEAATSETLPMSVLLGTDILELPAG